MRRGHGHASIGSKRRIARVVWVEQQASDLPTPRGPERMRGASTGATRGRTEVQILSSGQIALEAATSLPGDFSHVPARFREDLACTSRIGALSWGFSAVEAAVEGCIAVQYATALQDLADARRDCRALSDWTIRHEARHGCPPRRPNPPFARTRMECLPRSRYAIAYGHDDELMPQVQPYRHLVSWTCRCGPTARATAYAAMSSRCQWRQIASCGRERSAGRNQTPARKRSGTRMAACR